MTPMDTQTIVIIATIVSCVIGVLTFLFGRMSKQGSLAEWRGRVSESLHNISESIDKIITRLDNYQEEQANIHNDLNMLKGEINVIKVSQDHLEHEVAELRERVGKV